MKKYFLLLLMVMGGAVPAIAFGATLSVSPASGTYQTGNIITAQIIVDTQGAPIEGADIRYLNYDPALVEVQDENSSLAGVQIAPGTLMPTTAANTVDAGLGRIAFSQVISGNTTFAGTGVLATVRFRVLGPGSANVAFTFTQGNTADTNIASAGTDVLTSVAGGAYTLTAVVQQLKPIISLSPASGNKTAGTSFSFDIVLDTGGTAIDGADIVMTYSRLFVKVLDSDSSASGVQITPGTLMPNTVVNTVNTAYGSINFSQTTAASTSFTGSGVLATVDVQALAPGTANFTFTFVKGRTTDTNISFGGTDLLDSVTNATFTIVDSGVPLAIISTEPSGTMILPGTLALKVTTNKAATCRYGVTPNVAYASMNRSFSSSDGVDHSVSLSSGFQAGQNNFYVRCSDRIGTAMTSDTVISFTILTDVTPPIVSQLSPSGTLFFPKGVSLSATAQDQNDVLGCKFSLTPNTAYTAMTRSLYLKGTEFSTFIYSNELHAGQNNFYVRCKDKAGNVNALDAIISFSVVAAPIFTISVEGGSNASAHMFMISFFSPDSTAVIASVNAWADRYGKISFTPNNAHISPGNYDVRIASDRFIARKLANMYVGGGAVISVPPLLAGDLNSDGVVNSLDWSIMDTQWSRMFSSADINKDGKVNTLDWGYIRKNWLQAGN